MKVTRIIRDYVEREVTKVYDKKIDVINKVYDELYDKLDEELDKITEEANKKALALLEGTGFKSSGWKNEILISHYSIVNKELKDKKNDLKQEQKKTIEDILVTLELGGTKEDLDKMISEIQ